MNHLLKTTFSELLCLFFSTFACFRFSMLHSVAAGLSLFRRRDSNCQLGLSLSLLKNPAPTDGWWDCLLTFQQLASLINNLCLHTVSVLLPSWRNTADKKDFSARDGTVNSILHRTARNLSVATVCIPFSCILAIVWTVVAHSHPNYQGCPPGACTTAGCVWDFVRGRIHPLFYLPVSEWLIATGISPASHSVRFELQIYSR